MNLQNNKYYWIKPHDSDEWVIGLWVESLECFSCAKGEIHGVDDVDVDTRVITRKQHESPSHELLHIYAMANDIFNDDRFTWREKFDLIFSEQISGRVHKIINLDYYNPDMDYQDDVRAFMEAFEERMKEFK